MEIAQKFVHIILAIYYFHFFHHRYTYLDFKQYDIKKRPIYIFQNKFMENNYLNVNSLGNPNYIMSSLRSQIIS